MNNEELCNINSDHNIINISKKKNYFNLEEIEATRDSNINKSSHELVSYTHDKIIFHKLEDSKNESHKQPEVTKVVFEAISPHQELRQSDLDIIVDDNFEDSERNRIKCDNLDNKYDPLKENTMYFSVNGFNQFEFNNDEKDRRLSYNELENGKNFFKYRYISQYLNSNYIRSSINSNNISRTSLIHAPDDKKVIKYNSLFLQKLEKGIFLFNLRKYEDSFKYLYDSKIIFNNEEFAELLLVFQGFDKNNIGDLLSKNKLPNKDYIILNSYMRKINFIGKGFLASLRFILSKLNLPKDSSLILQILDVFTEVFYLDNKDKFLDSNSVYLLASSILAINTMLHKDIPNLTMIKKEDFVKMNEKIDKCISEPIYDEIKIKKLDITYDYNELIYRRLSIKVIPEEELITERKEPDVQEFTIDEKGELYLVMLRKGEIFTKYGNKGNPHLRFVKLIDDDSKLVWKEVNVCAMFKKSKYLETCDMKDVYIGSSNTDIFQKYKIPPEFDQCCISVISSKRSLDLRKDDEKICKIWYQGIKYLIKKIKSLELLNNKNLYDEINALSEIISQIWRNEILPNWKVYGKYLHDGSNFRNDISVHLKKKFNFYEKIKKSYFSNSNMKIIDDDKSDFIFLYMLGIPNWVRSKIWQILVENKINFSENLFNYFLCKCEHIKFIENTSFDELIRTLVNDINKLSQKFFRYIVDVAQKDDVEIKDDLFKILRILTLYRPDITYSKQITYIGLIFLMNSDNYYTAFLLMTNMITTSFLNKFLVRDEVFIKGRYDFFEKEFKTYLPKVFKHLTNLDISISLFFYDWIEYLYIKTFPYKYLIRIWDIILVRGEVVLYEVALSIIKIQEKDLINIPVKEILLSLKRLPSKFKEDDFFELLYQIDLSLKFNTLLEENKLAKEKGLLFESLL